MMRSQNLKTRLKKSKTKNKMRTSLAFALVLLTTCFVLAQTPPANVTTNNALYFYSSGNAPDNQPWARFSEAWGIRFNSPDSRWVFSSKPTVLIGYAPAGTNWGNDNLLVEGKIGIGTTSPTEKLTVYGNIFLPLQNSI